MIPAIHLIQRRLADRPFPFAAPLALASALLLLAGVGGLLAG